MSCDYMPTYSYKCDACGAEFEIDQSIHDKPKSSCVKCKKPRARRMISGNTKFVLKGSGWASDGYKG